MAPTDLLVKVVDVDGAAAARGHELRRVALGQHLLPLVAREVRVPLFVSWCLGCVVLGLVSGGGNGKGEGEGEVVLLFVFGEWGGKGEGGMDLD
jgi:hypothetical protein